jgi:hypothetical protein
VVVVRGEDPLLDTVLIAVDPAGTIVRPPPAPVRRPAKPERDGVYLDPDLVPDSSPALEGMIRSPGASSIAASYRSRRHDRCRTTDATPTGARDGMKDTAPRAPESVHAMPGPGRRPPGRALDQWVASSLRAHLAVVCGRYSDDQGQTRGRSRSATTSLGGANSRPPDAFRLQSGVLGDGADAFRRRSWPPSIFVRSFRVAWPRKS